MVPIVKLVELRQSKGDFIGETVNSSYRFSFMKQISSWSQMAYRIKYTDYEKKTSLRLGFKARINEKVSLRMMVTLY